jgi:3-oxoacyl-[acyl-carrier protein] reductase
MPGQLATTATADKAPRINRCVGRKGMAGEFSGKVVVVTGGSRGIGKAIAQSFARDGAQTVLAASSAANLEAAANAIASSGAARPLTVAGDLRQPAGCDALFARVRDEFGRCDVLVNCAGATKAGAFLAQSDAEWHDGFALKFFGAVRLCRLFWPLLKEAQGHVINIMGGAARNPDPDFLIGGAVNAAMGNFNKGLSQLGKRDGVNVNAILPGATVTERFKQLLEQRAAASGKSVEELHAAAIAKDGLRRLGKPEDISELTLFLCSDRARHIQGTAIAVDGGASRGYV